MDDEEEVELNPLCEECHFCLQIWSPLYVEYKCENGLEAIFKSGYCDKFIVSAMIEVH